MLRVGLLLLGQRYRNSATPHISVYRLSTLSTKDYCHHMRWSASTDRAYTLDTSVRAITCACSDASIIIPLSSSSLAIYQQHRPPTRSTTGTGVQHTLLIWPLTTYQRHRSPIGSTRSTGLRRTLVNWSLTSRQRHRLPTGITPGTGVPCTLFIHGNHMCSLQD